MKNIFKSSIILLIVLLAGCNKEPAVEPSAEFTLSSTSLTTGDDFIMYTDDLEGDWATYFTGADSTTTYSETFYRAEGNPIDMDLDSIVVSAYRTAGEYAFTVVVSSSGNWNEDYEQDVKSVTITVTD